MSWLLEIIYLLNFIAIIVILFVERKKPSTAFVWILILAFLPVVGFILYPILGRNLRPNQKRQFRLKKEFDLLYDERLRNENRLTRKHITSYLHKDMHPYEDHIKMNLNAGSIYSQDNDITIYTSGSDKFNALLEDIKSAKETIHMLYYIINNDDIGNKIVKLLTKKASEGVEVRLLYDHIGSLFTPQKLFKSLKKAGGKVYPFFPLRFGTYLRVNYRNHRKLAIIDGKIGYVGGMNVGDEYLGLHRRLTPWRDTHLRVTGTSVYALQERFLMDWVYASEEKDDNTSEALTKFFPPIENSGNTAMQVMSSGPDVEGEPIKRSYIKMAYCAKKTIYIQTPYFIPDDSFLESVQIAALSGVDVRIMLPAVPDKLLVYRATFSYISELLKYGVKVYLYPGFLHSKMLVIDGNVASIGTANMDIRSFSSNFEINTFIYNSEFSTKCKEIFEKDMAISKLLTKEVYEERGLHKKVQESICRLFSPLL
jgi:cardiolipin synthase A/B